MLMSTLFSCTGSSCHNDSVFLQPQAAISVQMRRVAPVHAVDSAAGAGHGAFTADDTLQGLSAIDLADPSVHN